MKSVWHQQIKWRQQGILFVFLFLLAASINVPLALQYRRPRQAPRLPNDINVFDEEAAAKGWPSETPHERAWPKPTQWSLSHTFGYTIIDTWSSGDQSFQMQYEQVGWPLTVYERTWFWWPWNDPAWQSNTITQPEYYKLQWVGLIGNPLIVGAVSWLFLFLLFPGRVLIVEVVRRSRGKCIKCGYDLRGEFESGCSECGWNRGENVEKSKHQNVKNEECGVEQ